MLYITEIAIAKPVSGMKFTAVHLYEYAKRVWQTYRNENPEACLPWSLLTGVLSGRLGTQNTEWTAKEKLNCLKQSGSVQEYARTCRRKTF